MPLLKHDVVRRLREQKCWSQEELGHRAGVSPRTIQRIESGSAAKLDTIALVAEALEIPPEDLIREPPPTVPHPTPTTGSCHDPADIGPIPVVLHRMSDGNELLDIAMGSLAMLPHTRGITDPKDAKDIGSLFEDLGDYGDIGDELSTSAKLAAGIALTGRLRELKARGWWIFAAKKRHSFMFPTGTPRTMPWTTGVIMATRADDSAVLHREVGEPVALVVIPKDCSFSWR